MRSRRWIPQPEFSQRNSCPTSGGDKRKKKKKRRKKKKAEGGDADAGKKEEEGGEPSIEAPCRLLPGFTDYYRKYGQTQPPTIPVRSRRPVCAPAETDK